MTRARTLADLGSASLATDAEATASAEAAAAAVPTGRKNLLYNGAMQVAQRGTSKTGIGSGDSNYHTSDRWYTTVVGSPTFEFTQSVENDAPTGSGFRKCLKMLCTTAQNSLVTSDSLRIEQRLEGQDIQRVAKGTASAQQVTLSFWVKSNVTGNYVAGLLDNDNTRYVAFTYNVSASATWEKKTIAFPADTTGAFDNDSGYSLSLQFWLAAGPDRATGTLPNAWESYAVAESAVGQTNLAAATNNYWQITGVQLEVGDTATDFEHKPFGVELAECQRYLKFLGSATGIAISGSQVDFPFSCFDMRAVPSSITQTGVIQITDCVAANYTQSSVSASIVNPGNSQGTRIRLGNFSGLTGYRSYIIEGLGNNAYLSAEL